MTTFAEREAKLEKATEALLQEAKDEKKLIRLAGNDFEELREEIVFAGLRVRKFPLRKTPKELGDPERKQLQASVAAAVAANRKYDEALHAHLMDMIELQTAPHRLVVAILRQRRKNLGDHLYADQINAAFGKYLVVGARYTLASDLTDFVVTYSNGFTNPGRFNRSLAMAFVAVRY